MEITGNFSNAAVTIYSLKINGSRTLTLSGQLTIQTAANAPGGIIQTGGSGTITGNSIRTNGTGDLVVRVDGSGNTLTFSSTAPILAPTTGLTKNGDGTLVLNGANTYTGTINLNEGTLKVGNAALAAANVALTIRQGATLDLNGITPTASVITGLTGAGTVTNSAASGTNTLTVGNNNIAGYFTGTIQDGGAAKVALTKVGTQTLYLTGNNSFTGPVTISAGVLGVTSLANIGTASALGAGIAGSNAASLVLNGGTLQYTGSTGSIVFQPTQTPSVSIDRLFTLGTSGGTIDSSGSYGSNGLAAAVPNHAALIFNNVSPVAFSSTASPSSLTLTGSSLGDNELRPRLTDPGTGANILTVTKASTGMWILNPAAGTPNIYTGNTIVTGGILQADEGVGLPTNSNLQLNGGVFQSSGPFTRTPSTTAGGNNVQWTAAGGFAASSSKLTVNLAGGGLTMGAAPFNTSTLILNSATAQSEVEFQNALNLGTAARTIQVDDNTTTTLDFATISGQITSGSNAASLIKTGAGTLQLTNTNNTYTSTAGTLLQVGTLVVGLIGNSLSTGSNIGAGSVPLLLGDGTTGAPTLQYVGQGETSDRSVTLAGTGTGAVAIEANGSGPLKLTAFTTGTSGARTLTLRGYSNDANEITSAISNAAAAVSIAKDGPGTWTLSGANTYSGTTTVIAGTLNLTNTLSNAALGNIVVQGGATLNISSSITGSATATALNYGTTAGNAIVNVTGGTQTLYTTAGGALAGAVSVWNQTGGTVILTPGTGTGTQAVVKTAGGYGYLNITGGTYRVTNGAANGRFTIASGVTGLPGTANSQTGVIFVGGATGVIENGAGGDWMLNYGVGMVTVADSGKIDRTGAANPYGLMMDSATTSGVYGVLNLAGSGAQFIAGGKAIQFGNNATNGAGNSGFVNLAAGTLSMGVNVATNLPAAPSVINNGYFNYAGGTIKATNNLTAAIPVSSASINFNQNVYGAIDNSAVAGAPSFSGGVTIDTNGFAVAIANPIQAPGGAGVTQANLTVAGGSGYVGAPAVMFSSTGVLAGGSPASGYALISGGAVTGIVITSPGTYTSGTVPTITLIGGGGTGASVTATALTTANVSGGLTKIGTGTLSLSGTNTYTGTTSVSAGTLDLSGSLNGSSVVTSGTGVFTQPAAGVISGTGVTFTQGSSGTSILAGANIYTGTTTVNAGTLSLSGSVGNGAVSVTDLGTLSGKGTIGTGTAGQLNLGSSSGANLRVDAGTAGALQVNGNVALIGTNTVYLDTVAGINNTLFNYTGTLTGTSSNLALGNPGNYRPGYSFSVGTGSNSSATLALVSGALTWTGSASNVPLSEISNLIAA